MSRESYAATLSRFADRLFVTGGEDPGDDVLPVEPSRLAVYHELLRRNYTSMIRFAYTMTFRLIAAEITEHGPAPGVPESVERIICRFLEVSPASGHSTRHIADVFRTFFEHEYAALIERRPEIPDLMTLERAELAALYAFDDPGRSPEDDEIERLARAPVSEFLALRVLRAPSAATLRLAWPATRIHERYAHKEPVAAGELRGAERVVVSRDPRTLAARFATLDEAPFLVLTAMPPGAWTPIEDLAAAWLPSLPGADAAHDDAWKLTTLAATVLTSLRTGALRLSRTDGGD